MRVRLSAAVLSCALSLSSLSAFAGDEPGGEKCDKKIVDDTKLIAATPRAEAPSIGPRTAAVTVEVWSDFQCPFCARGAGTIEKLREKYGDSVRIVFRHMPLPMHKNARLAAAAAMAANEQGKFWQMHDVLFDNPGALDRASLEKYAQGLGLDLERFRKSLNDKAWDNYLDAEVQEARRRGIVGTPVFFINDQAVMGARPVEELASIIDAKLKR